MKKLIIYGILIGILTMGITLFYTGDIIGDDEVNMYTIAIGSLILILTIGSAIQYAYQIKNTKAEGKLLSNESWDGIKEYDNDIPKGWALAFLASIVFVMYYILIGYPTSSFSQIGQYNEEVLAYNKKFEQKWEKIKDSKEDLLKIGESSFLTNCAVCHGVLADGLSGKSQNLLSFGSEEYVLNTIINGASGLKFGSSMPKGLASGQDAKAIAAYVSNKFFENKYIASNNLINDGKTLYDNTCAACHGSDGNGLAQVGPSLRALGIHALNLGKKGKIGLMPSFKTLNNIEKKALNTYIYNLKN